jgi:hypothetical protein
MPAFGDWFPLATVGLTFTILASLKPCGLKQGIVGGSGKTFNQRLCGTRATWKSRSLRLGLLFLFLGIGLFNLGWLGWLMFPRARRWGVSQPPFCYHQEAL